MPGTPRVETTPLVVGDVMFATQPPNGVIALDARSGRRLWSFTHPLPKLHLCDHGPVNRGLAVLDDTVYIGTLDAHLIALSARTGKVRWDTIVADYRKGYSITGAPLAVKDKIITGTSLADGRAPKATV